MRSRKWLAATAIVGLTFAALAGPNASADPKPKPNPLKGKGEGLKLIANVPYKGGTDMEFLTVKGRDYALAGSEATLADGGGMHVIDITNPEKPKEVAWLKCAMSQADIQISYDQKTAIMAADSTGGPDACLATTRLGFMTIDIRNPLKPKPIGFAEIPRGSHNTTAMPNAPYVYNSDSDLTKRGEIQIWSIKNPAKPKLAYTVDPVLGLSPHDQSFSADGKWMVTAGINRIDIYDTSDPVHPKLAYVTQCPGCTITHDAKFTPDMKHVIVGDEGGGGATYPCPGGALYFYDFSIQNGQPVMTPSGAYEPQEVGVTDNGPGGCTAHVFDISDDGTKLSISWYTAGTRYLDISAMVGPTVGPNGAPTGVKELGWFQPVGGNTWSSKMYKDKPYIYANDINRGFDVFKIETE